MYLPDGVEDVLLVGVLQDQKLGVLLLLLLQVLLEGQLLLLLLLLQVTQT